MIKEVTIRFSGEQGSGVQYTGQLAAGYFSGLGYDVFAVNDFESRIRGGYSFVQMRIGVTPGYSIKKAPDISIPFSRSVVEKDIETLSSDTFLILSKDSLSESLRGFKKCLINFEDILESRQFRYINTFFVSLLTGIFGSDLNALKETLQTTLKKKGRDIIDSNIFVAEIGHKYAGRIDADSFKLQMPGNSCVKTRALSGSYALSAGAVVSNCRFYSAYPMSPSTSIIEYLSEWSKDFGIITEQAEDEISALNLAIGASYAGVRAMVGTSGGGLALMSETVSLAGVSEVPVVIVNGQRPGPATGLPTRTEQGDLFFTIFMGHGEFTKVILAPGTHEKAFELTQKAFYLADKYQIPVFILTDQYLMDSLKSCEKWLPNKKFMDRFIDFSDDEKTPYLRYKLTKDGISPRKIAGLTKNAVVADSHTHDETGLISEDGDIKKRMTEKLLKKKDRIMAEDISDPYISNNGQNKNIVIGWGSTFGVINDAVQILNKNGFVISHIHFHEVYPLRRGLINQLLKGCKKTICVENNATGQFAGLLRLEANINVDDNLLKYDGRPFYLDEVVSGLESRLEK